MASREEMIDTIYRTYKARDKGDIEGVMVAFHPNAVFEINGEREILEIAGPVEGFPNVRTAMTVFIETFEFVEREILDAIVEGDRVAVHLRLKVRFVPRDVVVTTLALDMFRFENDKIIELVEFADTALIKSLTSA